MKLSKEEEAFIKDLPPIALQYYFHNKKDYTVNEDSVPQKLKKVRATFVTINKDSCLRGCVGKIKATYPIYHDIIKNTYKAAFEDPRFPQVKKEELSYLDFEVSILSKLKTLKYQDNEELKQKLKSLRPGIVIKYRGHRATYLPQVWEQIESPEKFLTLLCQKAGINPWLWKTHKINIEIYSVCKI